MVIRLVNEHQRGNYFIESVRVCSHRWSLAHASCESPVSTARMLNVAVNMLTKRSVTVNKENVLFILLSPQLSTSLMWFHLVFQTCQTRL